jgi:PKD repeat protein
MDQKRLIWCVMGIMLLCFTWEQVSFAGWSNATPAISTKTLYAVWGTSPSDVYAVGDTGTILHFNGTDWSAEASNTTGQLLSIWGASPTNIYVVGNEETGQNRATLLRKKAVGANWEFEEAVDYITQAPFDYNLTTVWGLSASKVYISDVYGDPYVFDGTGWIKIDPVPPVGSASITGIWAANSTNLFVTDSWSTDVSRYNGTDWAYLEACPDINPDDHLNEIVGFSVNDIYVAGSNGCISHFNGTDWQAVSSNTSKMLNSIYGNISANIIAVGAQGAIVHKKTANPEFTDESFNTVNDLFGVWVSPDGSVAYAVGTDGMILRWVPDTVSTTTTISGGNTTTTTPGGNTTTTIPGGGTTTVPGGTTTTSVPGGTTTTIPGGVTTSIVPPGEVGADFIGNPLTGRVGLQVQFTNLSGGDIASYQWTFGDGDASTEKNPSHVYNKRGTYSVILTVIGTSSKTATKIRENYITVKSRCAIVTSLDNSSQIEALRTIRDANLSDLSGALLTAIYYRNLAEISALFEDDPELRSRFRELVNGNSDVLENVLQGHQTNVSPAAVADVIVYLEELKLKGSITLQQNIDFVILGIRSGLLLNGLGIAVQ